MARNAPTDGPEWRTLRGSARSEALDRAVTTGVLTEAGWYREMQEWLETAFLTADTPYGQSGSGGDEERWERKRRLIADAIHRDGAFLDVGCANGLLLESIVDWAAVRGHRIEPYGLDISPAILALARLRLPHWADRLFIGNALTWRPPFRFDFVRAELVYVPPARRRSLLKRLLRDVVAPGGRLILCGYDDGTVADQLRRWGEPIAGTAEAHREDGRIWTQVVWLDAPLQR